MSCNSGIKERSIKGRNTSPSGVVHVSFIADAILGGSKAKNLQRIQSPSNLINNQTNFNDKFDSYEFWLIIRV